MFTGPALLICRAVRLPRRLKRPIDVMPTRSILSLVPDANIVGPPCRLHKQHEAVIDNRNVLKPRLPFPNIRGTVRAQIKFFAVIIA